MKYILAISTLLLAIAAHAVRAGDRIEFEYTYETTSGASRGWSSRHVVDHWDQNYLLAEEFHLVGYSPSIYEKVYSHSEILTDDVVQIWLSHCEYNKGIFETVVVPAGSFRTCRTETYDEFGAPTGTLWIGDVPMGVVMNVQKYADGTTFTFEASNFQHGGI